MTTPEERERGERLRAYVRESDGVPVIWGQSDCSTWAAQWVSDETGRDIDWPAYDSSTTAQAIIDAAGGLENVWAALARQAGLAINYDEPKLGDVGIVHTSRFGDVGGIFAHGGVFLWRHEKGVGTLSPIHKTIVRVWSL